MPSSPEVHGATVEDDHDDFPAAADLKTPEQEPDPRDPAMLAAVRMLADALDRPSTQADAAQRVGAVLVIRSPSAAWSPYLLRALRDVLPGTEFARMRVPERPGASPDSWSNRGKETPTWRVATESRQATEGLEATEEHIWSGYGAVGISHDLAFLQQFLLEAADAVLEVAEPGAGVLLAASAVCSDGPGAWPWGDLPVAPTPGMLRAAFRNGAPVQDCHARMRKVLEGKLIRDRTSPTGDGWTLDRLRGQKEFVAWGHGLAEDLRAWTAGELPWSDVAPGCMLVGPPGTGKTSAAKALAGSCGVTLIATSFSAWSSGPGSGHLGDVQKEMRAVFERAKKQLPCILFIDELDSITARGASREYDDWWRPVVNSLLECLDGVACREGLVVVGAANTIDTIDAAILRSGRLDRVIEIGLPDAVALAEILGDHLGDGWDAADLGKPARLMLGRSGADAARVVRDARQSARQSKREVSMSDLIDACHGKPRDPAELRATALHEAAHAVAAEIKMPGSVDYISLASGDERLGGCAVRRLSGNVGRDAIEDRVVALLAGRAAEELLLGGPQAGCGGPVDSDLSLATGTLLRARLCQGLYGEAAWRGDIGPGEVAAILRGRPDLHRWIEERLAALQDEAVGILAQHDVELLAVAGMLTENTVLTGDEVRAIMVS